MRKLDIEKPQVNPTKLSKIHTLAKIIVGSPKTSNILSFLFKALPLHEPRVWSDDETQSISNLTSGGNATFVEMRPFQSSYYYVLVVTQGQVSFDLSLEFYGCKNLFYFQLLWHLNKTTKIDNSVNFYLKKYFV